ncbi:hypothetical protein KUTeg_005286 [Tegillarca granosa]|uniref:Homeobox domain-containing protein n=1 Tax=Tegillarca granosa TaxID=220873 RepID=A0ABQ9FN78_TEGGR|nr:hypothetical protein KUTeg_005286 [Tegillarca granosa]
MNTNVHQPQHFPFPHGFWPFAATCGMKSLEMNVHPAFMHTPYPSFPMPCTTSLSPLHPGNRSKSDSFTIDAILSRDRVDDVQVLSPGVKSPNYNEKDSYKKDSVLSVRRHQRLYENSHPYLVREKSTTPIKRVTDVLKIKVDKDGKKSPEGSEWKQAKGKRIRTIFTPEQLERLEAEFEKQQYMVGTERYYLACSLNLSEAQVKVWFQNRRIKWRKQNLEQQQAKLAKFDLFKDVDAESDSGLSEIETEVNALERMKQIHKSEFCLD